MCSGCFAEFERQALRAIGTEEQARFAELSRAGDRPGMIALLAERLSCPMLADHYRGKDEARAARILQQVRLHEDEEDSRRTAAVLTEALACVPPGAKGLLLAMLARRARAWHRSGDLPRCAKDCRRFVGAADGEVDIRYRI